MDGCREGTLSRRQCCDGSGRFTGLEQRRNRADNQQIPYAQPNVLLNIFNYTGFRSSGFSGFGKPEKPENSGKTQNKFDNLLMRETVCLSSGTN